jgi:AcrR family transcriptional regulator
MTIQIKEKVMKPKRKRRDGILRQTQIMEIALRLFSQKGYHATSIDDIIGEAGIVKGTFYLHFESKHNLLESIIDNNLRMLFESIKLLDISMPKPVSEVKEFYIQISRGLMQNEDMRLFVKVFLRDAFGLDQKLLDKINIFFHQLVVIISDYIAKAQADGRVVKYINPLVISYSIIGSVKEVLFHWAVLDEKLDIDATITTLLDVYFGGMLEKGLT